MIGSLEEFKFRNNILEHCLECQQFYFIPSHSRFCLSSRKGQVTQEVITSVYVGGLLLASTMKANEEKDNLDSCNSGESNTFASWSIANGTCLTS